MAQQRTRGGTGQAISICELAFDAWRRPTGDGLNDQELALALADYACENAFTHVALLRAGEGGPEDPTGHFAQVAHDRTPDDLIFLVDSLHQAGIGVIVDGLPGPYAGPADEHAEFDAGRWQIGSQLRSNVLFWLDRYHIDGLHFAALDTMLYLDYGRRPGEWRANRYGGKENLAAVDFLRELNTTISRDYPGVFTIAAGVSGWPMVSGAVQQGGLGFSLVQSSGWPGAILGYLRNDPWFRKFHHDQLTESVVHAFDENAVLALSFDTPDQVHGPGALLEQMPGDAWQRRAGLRGLFGYMWAHPGKKLLRMGAEFGMLAGQHKSKAGEAERARVDSEDWGGLWRWVGDLNRLYCSQPALHALDFDAAGFLWIEANDRENSVLSFLRCARDGSPVLVVCNFTPVLRTNYVVGVPAHKMWREALNSEASIYGGSGAGNFGRAEAMPVPAHGQPMSLALTLPPHGVLFFVPEDDGSATL